MISESFDREPSRPEVEQMAGLVLLEFGASWCGHCQGIASVLSALLTEYPKVRHLAIEDGPGRPLGRSFRVKLWPTLVFLRDGQVVRQMVRPDPETIREGFEELSNPG